MQNEHSKRAMTIDEMLQGGERDLDVILQRTHPSRAEIAKRAAQNIFGVIFPWMLPTSEE